jgi:hypothetical protein
MSDWEEFTTKIIKRPFIPFWELLSSGIEVGSCVIVKGRVPRFANQFVFNFIVGNEISSFARDCADIALQFNPRFDEGLVANNSRIRTYWGIEERHRKEFPFGRNEWFEVKFLIKESFIKIFVDGKQFALFLHRIPHQYIGIFSIEGDVEVESVVFARDSINQTVEQRLKQRSNRMISNGEEKDMKRTQYISSPSYKMKSETEIKQQIDHNFNVYASQHSVVDNMVLSQKTIYNPPLPFSHCIFDGLKTGMIIIINGQTKASPQEFNVALQCSPSSAEVPDVALSLSVLFDTNQVIRKCRIDGEWLKQETDVPFFPFKNNKSEQYFELKIEVDSNRFVITFNGIYLAEYISRIADYKSANMLEVGGDVNIIYVKIDACEVN